MTSKTLTTQTSNKTKRVSKRHFKVNGKNQVNHKLHMLLNLCVFSTLWGGGKVLQLKGMNWVKIMAYGIVCCRIADRIGGDLEELEARLLGNTLQLSRAGLKDSIPDETYLDSSLMVLPKIYHRSEEGSGWTIHRLHPHSPSLFQ